MLSPLHMGPCDQKQLSKNLAVFVRGYNVTLVGGRKHTATGPDVVGKSS